MAFKDFFIKPDEQAPVTTMQQQVVTAQPVTVQQVAQSVITQPINTVVGTSSTVEHSEDIVKTLWTTLIDRNLPGPDFLELKQNASALAGLGLPLEKQYEGAFNVLKTQYPNFTKQAIIDSIDKYIEFINEEKTEGEKQCQQKRNDTVGAKQTRVSQLQENAQNILNEIESLKTKYEEINKSISQLNAEIETSTVEINQQEAVFNKSIDVVINSLNIDKQKISSLNI